MKKDKWSRKLDEVKQSESPESVLLVAGDAHLTRIVVTWLNMDVGRKNRLSRNTDAGEEGIWRWLWDNTQYSHETFLERIPGSNSVTPKKVRALIANRVLYPDGSANSYVEQYLRQKVVSLFGNRGRSHQAKRSQ